MEEKLETTQYLTFRLAEEVFAIDVERVREILEMTSITKVPQTPNFMRGVINLRGSVVPVIDMRLKFGMTESEQTVNTCIIVVEIVMAGEKMVVGALADSVQEVVDMTQEQIVAAPQSGTSLNSDFLKGMGRSDGRFVMILDIDNIFSSADLAALQGQSL